MESREELLNYIESNIDGTHYHMALLISKIYKDKYCVTTENNKDKWFRFNGQHWETSSSIIHELKIKLSSEIAPIISEVRTKIRNRLINLSNDERSFEETRMKKMTHIEQMLYNNNHKNNIIKELESLLYAEKLLEFKPSIRT